ncbi:MAG TPA: phosphoenolpyruvate--protein phosphotransferase [Lentisphaeria bacterium]|nr:phosphoenolpyruvate--protein phosphotransferase [Lentisphaerota bacterium]HPY89407.1 phosphoenolpyruvate--protein phosphotransferase [Lentisphaeria bacterium]HQC51755.1 phosphoenolpyruvate--protein phosphotransferase [Lentisphaeria bacterium]
MLNSHSQPLVLRGTGVSAGLVVGRVVRSPKSTAQLPDFPIQPAQIEAERERLRAALNESRQQLNNMQERLAAELSEQHAEIMTFHLMLLDDPTLLTNIDAILRTDLVCVEQATIRAIERFSHDISQKNNALLRERAGDIRDVGARILHNLALPAGKETETAPTNDAEPHVLVAEDIPPSEAAHMDPRLIAAFITAGGSRTSHTAILARALGIPAIVALPNGIDVLEPGTIVALDGETGEIHVNPDRDTIAAFLQETDRQKAWLSSLLAENHQPAETLDGYQTCLVANVELPSEAMTVHERYNVGIGLFRTEFLFLNSCKLLTEEEQFEAYKTTAETVHPLSVIFRTLDIGGDKFLSQIDMAHELNPFMGMRAIRFSLHRPDLFRVQLRAMLRASAYGKVRIMFPLISTLDELIHALEHLEEVKQDLRRRRIPFNETLDVGCMIEVPSAAILAERLVKHVDFFSIGTNDLVQYSLAVDRSNPDIAYLYQPPHPAILRLIRNVVTVACEHGKWVSLCGEMAAEPLYTPLVLGMGIHELSMSPVAIPPVRHLVRSINMYDAENLVAEALRCGSADEVEALCRKLIAKACPEMLPHAKKCPANGQAPAERLSCRI